MFKINAATRLKATSSHEDTSGEKLFAAEDIIAPSDSYKEKNEKQLEQQQTERETEEDKESTSDGANKEGTSVHDMGASAVKRLNASKR